MPVHISAAIRSPFTRVDGALAGWHPVDLAAEIMNAARGDAAITEVWIGCAEPVGAQGADMARAAILAAGWSDRIGGMVIDRAETSGAAALHAAAAAVASGSIAGAMVLGVCSASVVPPGASALARTYGRPWGEGPARRAEPAGGLLPAPAAAERAAAVAGITRSAQDAWSAGSHERRRLLVPSSLVAVDARPGEGVAIQRGAPISADDHRDLPTDPAALPPSFDPDGSVTGFTFAPPADGIVALVLGNTPGSGPEIIGVGRSAGDPRDPLGGIGDALAAAVRRAGIDPETIDRWELTEPTAAACLLAIERLGIDPALVNRAGGTLGVGDAGAAEELRLLVDAVPVTPAGGVVAAASYGPTGAAVTVIRCP